MNIPTPMSSGWKAIALAAAIATSALALAEEASEFLDPCDGELSITNIEPRAVVVDGFPATFDLTVTAEWTGPVGGLEALHPLLYFDQSESPVAGHNTDHPFNYLADENEDTGVTTFPVTIENEPEELPAFFSLELEGSRRIQGTLVGFECEQDFKVDVDLVQVEYIAPPAIANRYIREEGIKLNGRQRGCIISHIADQHAKLNAYSPDGNRGGPFRADWVEQDVETLRDGACSR
jgi:hypothetical protein